MLIKSYEIGKIKIEKNPFILLHGNNVGLKNQILNNLLIKYKITENYEEKEILDNLNKFLDGLLSKSLFETKKIILIKRSTEKILNLVFILIEKKIDDVVIIIDSNPLEKKSKLRSFFEKEKKCICIAFYPDDQHTLLNVAQNYLKERKIFLSVSDLNIIINNVNGDRGILLSELEKLELYTKNGRKINTDVVKKISNLIENHSISELVDNCLAKNKKKTLNILNENNFNSDDCVLILRIFLNKLKKTLNLISEFKKNNNIDLTISKARPPVFWKEKEITKKHIKNWKAEEIKKIIYELNILESTIKKNYNNSMNILIDFILNVVDGNTNN